MVHADVCDLKYYNGIYVSFHSGFPYKLNQHVSVMRSIYNCYYKSNSQFNQQTTANCYCRQSNPTQAPGKPHTNKNNLPQMSQTTQQPFQPINNNQSSGTIHTMRTTGFPSRSSRTGPRSRSRSRSPRRCQHCSVLHRRNGTFFFFF